MKRRVAGVSLGVGEQIKETTVRQTVMLGVVSLLLVFLASASTQAAVVTVDVTIKAVNTQSRGISVVYKTELGEKTIELDVSRKAEITINGKDGTLDAIGPGLKAKVAYDKDLAVVTKIEATGEAVQPGKRPELLAVSELNVEGENAISCLSPDGLTVYWTQWSESKKSTVWTAHRDDPQSLFADKKELLQGGMAAVSSDGLEMIFASERSDGQKGSSLHLTTRSAPDKPFIRPTEISEFAKLFAGAPCLSSDGLTLYFNVRSAPDDYHTATIVVSTRKDKSSAWSTPKPVPELTIDDGTLQNPLVTPDGLNLLGSQNLGPDDKGKKGNLLLWSRPALGRPFVRSGVIDPENLPPLVGATPKFVPATSELFFTRYSSEEKKRTGKWAQAHPERASQTVTRRSIWVVKNVTIDSLMATSKGESKTEAADEQSGTDLLALVVPQKHRIAGTWEEQNGQLIGTGQSTKKAIATCTIPFKATGSYLLHVEFTRIATWNNGFAGPTVALPVGKATAQFWLDVGSEHPRCGFSTPESDDVRFNKTGAPCVRLIDNTRYSLDIHTTVLSRGQAKVEATLNGKPYFHWIGRQDELRVSPFWMYPSDGSFGLGIAGKAVFHKVTYTAASSAHH